MHSCVGIEVKQTSPLFKKILLINSCISGFQMFQVHTYFRNNILVNVIIVIKHLSLQQDTETCIIFVQTQ